MKRYYTKMTETTKEKTKAYYKEGIRLLLQTGETMGKLRTSFRRV